MLLDVVGTLCVFEPCALVRACLHIASASSNSDAGARATAPPGPAASGDLWLWLRPPDAGR